HHFVSGRTDDGERADVPRQRQGAIVLEHHDRGICRTPRQVIVFGRLVHLVRNLRPLHAIRRIEHAKAHAREHETANGNIELRLAHQSFLRGFGQRGGGGAAVEIEPCFDGERRRFFGGRYDLVLGEDVVDRIAVGNDVTLEAPVLAEDVGQESWARGGGLAV